MLERRVQRRRRRRRGRERNERITDNMRSAILESPIQVSRADGEVETFASGSHVVETYKFARGFSVDYMIRSIIENRPSHKSLFGWKWTKCAEVETEQKAVETEDLTIANKYRLKLPKKYIPDHVLKTIVQEMLPVFKHKEIANFLNILGYTTERGFSFTAKNSYDYFERNRSSRYQNRINVYRIEIGLKPLLYRDTAAAAAGCSSVW